MIADVIAVRDDQQSTGRALSENGVVVIRQAVAGIQDLAVVPRLPAYASGRSLRPESLPAGAQRFHAEARGDQATAQQPMNSRSPVGPVRGRVYLHADKQALCRCDCLNLPVMNTPMALFVTRLKAKCQLIY